MMHKVLIFSCLSVAMLMATAYGAPTPEKQIIDALIDDVTVLEKSNIETHLKLYTAREKQECSRHTLQCYLNEMITLEKEIEDTGVSHVRNIKQNLRALLDGTPRSNPGTECKACEANDKKEFSVFLQELKNFLRSMKK